MTFEEWWQEQNVLPNADGWDRSIKLYAEKAWKQSALLALGMSEVKIKSFESLPNTLLVISIPSYLSESQHTDIRKFFQQLSSNFSGLCCYVSSDVSITTLKESVMNSLGWYRKEE